MAKIIIGITGAILENHIFLKSFSYD